MINQENKLTIDDLIIIYIAEKMKQGYIPEVDEEELMDFLKYFTKKIEVEDILWNYQHLIIHFFIRKNATNWFGEPHIDFTKAGTLKPNYRFSIYDELVINPYFMQGKIKKEVIDYITEYLKRLPKRTLEISNEKMIIPKEECKLSSALLMECLWRCDINKKIEEHKWPTQCTDIIKYLIEEDLALKVELESERKKYLEFYEDFAKKTSILLENDPKLKIENYHNNYLAYANYQIITENDQDNLLKKFCEEYGNKFQINFATLFMYVSPIAGVNKDFPNEENSNFTKNTHAKKLVKAIENRNQ